MKTKQLKKVRSIPETIERISCHRTSISLVLCLLVIGLFKVDGVMLKVLRQSYANGFTLLGTYMREEPTRMPTNVGSEMRTVTTSGT